MVLQQEPKWHKSWLWHLQQVKPVQGNRNSNLAEGWSSPLSHEEKWNGKNLNRHIWTWIHWWEKYVCGFHVLTWIHVYWKVFLKSITHEKHRTVINCLQLSQIFDVISCYNIMTCIITSTCFLIKWLCTSLHFQWGPESFFCSFVLLKSSWLEMWLQDRKSIMSAGEGS